MFIKIKDNNQYNARHQFIRTFGFECLQKIKKIQSSLKQINWEVSVCPFQSIVGRVKTVIESYQLIAHQIFDSCQSVKYDALGQAILKMFLQLSSTIKWLIKSFMANNGKRALPTQQIIQQKKQQTQTQKFRNRQISRFVLKGVMQQFNSQQNSNQHLDQSNQYLNENKENYKKSKSKVLSTNASNLPLILQDAIQTLKKKSDYIEKFVALRENYDNTYRYEQPMTSQAIFQSELGIKDNIATQKFKQIFNRIVNLNITRKINKNQLGVQTDSENNFNDKNKKALQKNKIKLMTQQLQKQKKVNKQLKIQLQIYEKRLIDSLKQNQQYQFFKKRVSMVPRYQKRIEKNYTKPQSQQKIDIQKLKSKLKQDDNIPKQKQQKFQQNKMPQSVQSNNAMSQEVKVVKQELNKKSLLLKKKSSMNIINRFNKQISIKGNSSFNKSFLCQITPQVFNLNYFKQKDFIKQNKQQKILWLKLESLVFNIIINNLGLKKEYSEQKLVVQQKLLSIGHLPANINQQTIINNQNGLNKLNRTHQTSTFKKLKDKNKNDVKIEIKGEQKKLDRQNNQQKKIVSLMKQNQQFFQFQKYFKRKQLLKIDISLDTLHQFFIEQNTAKNYELLNLSQICNHHKKLKLHPTKKHKLSVQVNSLFLSSSQGSRQIKTVGSQNQNTFSSVIVKQIFNQIIRIRKLSKETYLKIILFLRYPYSSVHRSEELYDKLDEFEQHLVRLEEINSHIKRIWSMHSKCETQKNLGIPYLWCKHKYFIINFFGFYQNLQIRQREH